MLTLIDCATVKTVKIALLIIGLILLFEVTFKQTKVTTVDTASQTIAAYTVPEASAPLKIFDSTYIIFAKNLFVNCKQAASFR